MAHFFYNINVHYTFCLEQIEYVCACMYVCVTVTVLGLYLLESSLQFVTVTFLLRVELTESKFTVNFKNIVGSLCVQFDSWKVGHEKK